MSEIAVTPLEALILVLAVYRFTILVVADELTAPARVALVRRLNARKHGWLNPADYDGPAGEAARALDEAAWQRAAAMRPHRLAVLLECPWCASPYVAAVIVPWAVYGDPGRVWWAIMGIAAASGVTGFLATKASP